MRRAIFFQEPIQAAPLTLNSKSLLPLNQSKSSADTVGWTYTYEGCPTNFLNCYFLDHSPCPLITVDPYDVKGGRERVRIWNIKVSNSTLIKCRSRLLNLHLPLLYSTFLLSFLLRIIYIIFFQGE